MESTINIPAILIANVMGLSILYVLITTNKWKITQSDIETSCISIMIISCVVNCIVDPICFLADGKPGLINRILVFGGNTLLYLSGIVISFVWIFLASNHMHAKLNNFHSRFLHVLFDLDILMLILNIFIPIVFTVDSNNVYSRLLGYWIHTFLYVIYMCDGLLVYFLRRNKSGGLKFFPVWSFILPCTLGVIIQAVNYGVSTAAPFTSVSICCVILSLQNEFVTKDKLTSLYNRFYLSTVEDNIKKNKKYKYSAIMLDINGFKKINDNYGHKIGDEALIELSIILTEAVGMIGEVIRYAGDEFIIVLNTQDEKVINETINRIHELINEFNTQKKAKYELSVSFGNCNLNLDEFSMDEFIDRIDKLMYNDKQSYYINNPKFDRRKR